MNITIIGIVDVDPRYFRYPEAETILAESAKAGSELGWLHQINLQQMTPKTGASYVVAAQGHALLKRYGHRRAVNLES